MVETVIFILSGIIMGLRLSEGNACHEHAVTGKDFAKVFANYALLHVIRFMDISTCCCFSFDLYAW